MPEIAVIGAGLTGLVCARTLTAAGHRVTIVEREPRVGGRLATRVLGDPARRCDTGAQFFTVRDPAFAALVDAWQPVVQRWSDGFPVATAQGVLPPDGFPRFFAPGGMAALAGHLARDLRVLTGRTVDGLAADAGGWRLMLSTGEELGADAVVMTAPAPQVPLWFQRWGLPMPPVLADDLAAVRFDPCLCALLDWPDHDAAVLPAPGGVRIDDPASPIGWLSSQRAKGLVAAGEILVVHARGDWSARHQDDDDRAVLAALNEAAQAWVARLGGIWPGTPRGSVERWTHSLAVQGPPARCRRLDLPAPLVVAGDGWGGQGRVEGAVLSGLAAAVL